MANSLKEKILDLAKKGKTYSEIEIMLNCAKSTISYHCKKEGLESSNLLKVPTEEDIKFFQKVYDENNSSDKTALITGWSKPTILKYVQVNIKEKLTDEELKINKIKTVISWRKRTKQRLVEYKGGCCEICGYNKCMGALDFHHKNPKEKDFGIGGVTKSFDKLKNEVDKCILVCANCHREIHEKMDL